MIEDPKSGGCQKCGSLSFSQEWFDVFGVIFCNSCRRDEELITKVWLDFRALLLNSESDVRKSEIHSPSHLSPVLILPLSPYCHLLFRSTSYSHLATSCGTLCMYKGNENCAFKEALLCPSSQFYNVVYPDLMILHRGVMPQSLCRVLQRRYTCWLRETLRSSEVSVVPILTKRTGAPCGFTCNPRWSPSKICRVFSISRNLLRW